MEGERLLKVEQSSGERRVRNSEKISDASKWLLHDATFQGDFDGVSSFSFGEGAFGKIETAIEMRENNQKVDSLKGF